MQLPLCEAPNVFSLLNSACSFQRQCRLLLSRGGKIKGSALSEKNQVAAPAVHYSATVTVVSRHDPLAVPTSQEAGEYEEGCCDERRRSAGR